MDGRTDGWTDMVKPVYSLYLVSGWYDKETNLNTTYP